MKVGDAAWELVIRGYWKSWSPKKMYGEGEDKQLRCSEKKEVEEGVMKRSQEGR